MLQVKSAPLQVKPTFFRIKPPRAVTPEIAIAEDAAAFSLISVASGWTALHSLPAAAQVPAALGLVKLGWARPSQLRPLLTVTHLAAGILAAVSAGVAGFYQA